MFLKSEDDERNTHKKKFHFDGIKVVIGFVLGFVTPEIARFLNERVIENETLLNISNVSQIGLAFVFALIMLFVTFRVEFVDEEKQEKNQQTGEQNEITDKLSEYHRAKEKGQKEKMKEIEEWLKEHGVTLKKK
mgnify:CR=1 FL=1|jgi:predicted PurR-regulated permease PerM